MGALAEYVRKEANQLKAEAVRRKTNLDGWVRAVDALYERLVGWLREADGGTGLVPTTHVPGTPVNEFQLGTYSVSSLRVYLGGTDGPWADVVPKARFVGGVILIPGADGSERQPDGLVEIRDERFATHYLYRVAGSSTSDDRWFIREAGVDRDEDYRQVEDLTQERFEAAVLRAIR